MLIIQFEGRILILTVAVHPCSKGSPSNPLYLPLGSSRIQLCGFSTPKSLHFSTVVPVFFSEVMLKVPLQQVLPLGFFFQVERIYLANRVIFGGRALEETHILIHPCFLKQSGRLHRDEVSAGCQWSSALISQTAMAWSSRSVHCLLPSQPLAGYHGKGVLGDMDRTWGCGEGGRWCCDKVS